MGIVDRIRQIIAYKNISVRKFCIEIGVANGFFDKVKDVGSEKVLKILKTYPEISPEWLITGQGTMLRESEGVNQRVSGSGNITIGKGDLKKINNRQYGSDAPDVLRLQIADRDRLLQEKEERIKEKDAQIKEKDAQINKLLDIIHNK